MENRDIQNGSYCWLEKGALEKIDTLPRRHQASCKLIYLALCVISSKQQNNPIIECYRFDLARYATVSDRTVCRKLPFLEELGIITIKPQDRLADGKYKKATISLVKANSSVRHGDDTAMTRERHGDDTVSDILNKEINKEINKNNSFVGKSDTQKISKKKISKKKNPLGKKIILEWTHEEKKKHPQLALMKGYEYEYQQRFGFRPKIPWVKYVRQFQQYAEEYEVAALVFQHFFTCEDQFIIDAQYSISLLATWDIYNRLKAELVAEKNPFILKALSHVKA